MSKAFAVAATLLVTHPVVMAQFMNSRDLQQDPVKLKVAWPALTFRKLGSSRST